jgi:hypothetical protein
MLDNRSNAYVEAMNGLLQQVKRAARCFRTVTNFIAIAYVKAQTLAKQSAAARYAQIQRAYPPLPVMSSSTLNGIEPASLSPQRLKHFSQYLHRLRLHRNGGDVEAHM